MIDLINSDYIWLSHISPLYGKEECVHQKEHALHYLQLVGGFNHLDKYESQWEGLSHILWKIKHFETNNQTNMVM